ncbi:MAG: ABC transporter substrate-binding protein [Schaedlerella sp.]|nr:ABC transporter substrate-binding protein [Schaedlerella sp.]
MKKKLLAMMLCAGMVISLAACGGGSSETSGEAEGGSSDGKTLRLINGKIEIDGALKNLAAKYEEETGVKVEIESMGGGVDIMSTVKGYYQGGNMPDMFVAGGSDFKNWEGLLVDMSDQAWTENTESEYVDPEYGTLGFPYTVEAVGLAYNAEILEKAGVDPASITGPESTKAAFEAIEAKKDELGLTAVVGWYTEPVNLWWSTGNHMFGNYLDAGLDRDDTTYIDLLSDGGQLDTDRLTAFAEYIGLLNEYADPATLVSGTYDQQIQYFSEGKYAFVTQGSWIGATMTSTNKEQYDAAGNFECGMVPYAFEEGIDTILTNTPSWWAVYDGDNVEESLAFLQWCSEDTAQKILVEEANFVSPFTTCTYVANDPFAQTILDYQAAGKISAWHWLDQIEGLAVNYTGQVFSDYAAGKLDTAGFVKTYEQVCQSAYAN